MGLFFFIFVFWIGFRKSKNMYLLRIPKAVRWLLPGALFDFAPEIDSQKIYLTFDDGPIPVVTEFVLEQLRYYEAKATFFMLGENVQNHPDIFEAVKEEGHQVGNHTFSHVRGTKTDLNSYLKEVDQANELILSPYFRPPYGQLSLTQFKFLKEQNYQVVMWSLMSGDFDSKISPEKCLEQVLLHIRVNDIVVFHDSIKAEKNLRYVLPKVLEHCQNKGWEMCALP